MGLCREKGDWMSRFSRDVRMRNSPLSKFFTYTCFLFLIFSNIKRIVQITTQMTVAIIQNEIAPFHPNLSTKNPVPLAESAAPT